VRNALRSLPRGTYALLTNWQDMRLATVIAETAIDIATDFFHDPN
jgi:hypothetical protein